MGKILTMLLAGVLLACGGERYGALLADARKHEGCEAITLREVRDGAYVLDGCGRTHRYTCLSDRNYPFCCYPVSEAPPATCDDVEDYDPRDMDSPSPVVDATHPR